MEELDQEYHIQIAIRSEISQNDQERNSDVETSGNGVGGYNFINCETETESNYVSEFLSNLQTILNINEHGDEATENLMFSHESALGDVQTELNDEHSQKVEEIPFKYKCVPCGKRFVTQARLSSHQRSHCPRQGVMSHIESQPFWCKTCRRSFPTHERFVQHKTPHPLANEYVCQTCGRHFTKISSFTNHKLSHIQEQPFESNVTKNGFISQGSLSSLELLYARRKPFRCDECDLCYGSLTALRKHRKQKHPTPPHKCHFYVSTL